MIQATKKIIVNGDKQTTVEDYALMTKRSRAGKNGKNLKCPECENVTRIYRMSFSSLTCPSCKQDINKYDWMVDQTDTWRTPK